MGADTPGLDALREARARLDDLSKDAAVKRASTDERDQFEAVGIDYAVNVIRPALGGVSGTGEGQRPGWLAHGLAAVDDLSHEWHNAGPGGMPVGEFRARIDAIRTAFRAASSSGAQAGTGEGERGEVPAARVIREVRGAIRGGVSVSVEVPGGHVHTLSHVVDHDSVQTWDCGSARIRVKDGHLVTVSEVRAASSSGADPERPCPGCGGRRWVEDENWSTYPDPPPARTPHDGLIPCGFCNEGGWDTPVGADSSSEPPRPDPDLDGYEVEALMQTFDSHRGHSLTYDAARLALVCDVDGSSLIHVGPSGRPEAKVEPEGRDLAGLAGKLVAAIEADDRPNIHGWSRALKAALSRLPQSEETGK